MSTRDETTVTEPTRCDVVIVGLGPTGATLANILGQYGWSVIVLERESDVYFSPRAVHFDDEAMRVFQSIGLAAAVSETSEPFREMEFALRPKAKAILRTTVGSQDRRYGHAGAWWFHQPTLERQLRAGLVRFAGVRLRFGVEVTDVTQNAEGVTATGIDSGGKQCVVHGRYLVGCDGGKSLVRSRAKLALQALDFDQGWVVVDAKARCGGKESALPSLHRQICDPRQPVTYVPVVGPYYRWEFMVSGDKPEQESTDPELVRKQLREFVEIDKIDLIRIACYRFHALWAKRWRNGRLILAGDAAHQMPPFLGQGMCSGIRDAHALGWRLDLILRGSAGEALLDSYEQERCRHVRHVIHGAVFLGRLIQTRNPVIAFFRNWLVFRPAAMSAIVHRFIFGGANRKRPLSSGFLGAKRPKLAGYPAVQPPVASEGGIVLLDEVLGNRFSLLSRAGSLDGYTDCVDRLKRIVPFEHVQFCERAADPIIGDCDRTLTQWFDRHRVDFVLVRPDRYVFDGGRARDLTDVVNRFDSLFPRSGAEPN